MSEPRSFLDGRVQLFAGDCREVLKTLADNSVDSVVTDPPYHLTSLVKRFGGENAKPVKSNLEQPADKNLEAINAGAFRRLTKGFMGKQWDGGDIAFQPELWAEVLRVLKPGGYIMAFSGCRTYHRMACAIEDAGFITHPFFAWAFGSGFPKAHSVSRQLDKSSGAEPIKTGEFKRVSIQTNGEGETRKRGAFASHPESTKHIEITAPATDAAREWDGWFYGTQSLKPALEPVYFGQKPFERGLNGAQNVQKWGTGAINVGACRVGAVGDHRRVGTPSFPHSDDAWQPHLEVAGIIGQRWPANLMHDNSEEVLACFPETTATPPGNIKPSASTNNVFGKYTDRSLLGHSDSGSAARFFASFPGDWQDENYSAFGYNTDNARRSFPQDEEASAKRLLYHAKADAADRCGSRHPTVKPIALLQELARLITRTGGLCLDLFAGSGTTAEACYREGFRCILIEREAEYIADIERRMALVMEGPVTRAHAGMKARGRPRDDGPLFGGSEGVQPIFKGGANTSFDQHDHKAEWIKRRNGQTFGSETLPRDEAPE